MFSGSLHDHNTGKSNTAGRNHQKVPLWLHWLSNPGMCFSQPKQLPHTLRQANNSRINASYALILVCDSLKIKEPGTCKTSGTGLGIPFAGIYQVGIKSQQLASTFKIISTQIGQDTSLFQKYTHASTRRATQSSLSWATVDAITRKSFSRLVL